MLWSYWQSSGGLSRRHKSARSIFIHEPVQDESEKNRRGRHKPGQRRAFFKYVESQVVAGGSAFDYATSVADIIEWAEGMPLPKNAFASLRRIVDDEVDWINPDANLYAYCRARGWKPAEHAFDGDDHVGDLLAEFAEFSQNRNRMRRLGNGGTYDIYRLGSIVIESGGKPNVELPKQKLEIIANPDSPHASFNVIDSGPADPKKPRENKGWWTGRVVATHDALYLIGVTQNYTDVAMMILWGHHSQSDMLVGMQLAKFAPYDRNVDGRELVTARRIVAVETRPGPKPKTVNPHVVDWLTQKGIGTVIRIDDPAKPTGNSD